MDRLMCGTKWNSPTVSSRPPKSHNIQSQNTQDTGNYCPFPAAVIPWQETEVKGVVVSQRPARLQLQSLRGHIRRL